LRHSSAVDQAVVEHITEPRPLRSPHLVVPPEPAAQWLNNLKAPHKEIVWFDKPGHALLMA
jgi:hypothetical protein